MNVDQLRADTPGCFARIHFNNAGSALMPTPVVRVIQEHIELESRIGGYEAADARANQIADAYLAVAELLGSVPRNVAFTENATASFAQALSAIPFQSGDVILTTRNDYVSNQIQFMSLQARFGVRVIRAPDTPDGGVDVAAMADLIRRQRPKLVSVTHVPTNSGLVQDVNAIGSVCRDENVLYLVDACQSLGQLPIDVERIGCDFLSATARKYLRGPRGSGILFVSDRVLELGMEPLFIDMRGADWVAQDRYQSIQSARRFENWEFAWSLVLGTGMAARYATKLGLNNIRDRVQSLAYLLRRELASVDGARILDAGSDLCGIVSVAFDRHDPVELAARLRQRGVNTTGQIRIYAVIDYEDKGVAASLRLSPHYYNTETEIDQAVSVVRELLAEA